MINIESTKKKQITEHKIGIFGQSGSGKTSLIKTLPCGANEVLVIDVEGGLEVLRGADYAKIDFEATEGKDIIDRMRSIIVFLSNKEGLNGYKWVVWDSVTMFAEKLLSEMEKNPKKWGHLSSSGAHDTRSMYGDIKKYMTMIHEAFLRLKNVNKLCIYGADEVNEGPETSMSVLLPGSFKKIVAFHLDEFWGVRVKQGEEKSEYQLVLNSDGFWKCKSRMIGGSNVELDIYQPAHIGEIIKKCYGDKK